MKTKLNEWLLLRLYTPYINWAVEMWLAQGHHGQRPWWGLNKGPHDLKSNTQRLAPIRSTNCVQKMQTEWQTAWTQIRLACLLIRVCPNIKDHALYYQSHYFRVFLFLWFWDSQLLLTEIKKIDTSCFSVWLLYLLAKHSQKLKNSSQTIDLMNNNKLLLVT